MDLVEVALERARERSAGIENVCYRRWNAVEEPPPGDFELVVCMDVVDSGWRPLALRRAVRSVCEAVTPGGLLLVTAVKQNPAVEGARWARWLGRGANGIQHRFRAADPALTIVDARDTSTHVLALYERSRASAGPETARDPLGAGGPREALGVRDRGSGRLRPGRHRALEGARPFLRIGALDVERRGPAALVQGGQVADDRGQPARLSLEQRQVEALGLRSEHEDASAPVGGDEFVEAQPGLDPDVAGRFERPRAGDDLAVPARIDARIADQGERRPRRRQRRPRVENQVVALVGVEVRNREDRATLDRRVPG